MHRSVPVAGQFIIEPQQGDGAARHFERGDITADERTSDGNIPAAQNLRQFIGNHI